VGERGAGIGDHARVTAAGADVDRSDPGGRAWLERAVALVEADARRSADTHLLVHPLPPAWGVDLYLKDESTHPTGSLKHRLARSLFLYALCSGQLTEGSTVVEASSGSTAVSEAYFARMLGLPFVAVMPASTSPEKIALIEFHGGRCHLVTDAGTVYDEARRIAALDRVEEAHAETLALEATGTIEGRLAVHIGFDGRVIECAKAHHGEIGMGELAVAVHDGQRRIEAHAASGHGAQLPAAVGPVTGLVQYPGATWGIQARHLVAADDDGTR